MKKTPIIETRNVPEKEIERDRTILSLQSKATQAQKKYKIVSVQLKEAREIINAFRTTSTANFYSIKNRGIGSTGEATAVALLSDVHFAETVKSDNVNGNNKYSPKIAKARLEMFFISLVKLIKIFGEKSVIRTAILALLGDFINGQLREEAMENNSMRPIPEMLAVENIVKAGIKYILNNTSVDLIVPCHSGNHARITKKIHVSTEAGNSLENVMYHHIANGFLGEKRVRFVIPESYHSFVKIGGVSIRFHHGHFMKYLGGVGGIYISINKAIAQWNKVQHADIDVFGHFHQLRDGGNFFCNGSVIGWNEYANSIKADFERPKQGFFLIDHKRKEKTVTAPIFLS